jgi:hypothetical protein
MLLLTTYCVRYLLLDPSQDRSGGADTCVLDRDGKSYSYIAPRGHRLMALIMRLQLK